MINNSEWVEEMNAENGAILLKNSSMKGKKKIRRIDEGSQRVKGQLFKVIPGHPVNPRLAWAIIRLC